MNVEDFLHIIFINIHKNEFKHFLFVVHKLFHLWQAAILLLNLDKLKYQLWANMIVIAVKKFKDSLQLCTKEEILALKQLLGYGMVCGGDGSIGVYKLEMRFGQNTAIVTKIELGARERLTAAALMDFNIILLFLYVPCLI